MNNLKKISRNEMKTINGGAVAQPPTGGQYCYRDADCAGGVCCGAGGVFFCTSVSCGAA